MEDNIVTLQKEVSIILLRDWDPLGVADFPEARNEYEAYAAEIVAMHQNGMLSAEKLFEYLRTTAEKTLNKKADDIAIGRAAKNILELFKSEATN